MFYRLRGDNMKKIIRHNREPIQVHLSDIVDKISHIIICDDIYKTYSIISSSTEFENDDEDMSNEQFYLTLSDDNLLELSNEEIRSITNIELLGRIAKLDIERLSLTQRKLLKDAYGQKVISDKQDIANLLSELRQCKSISYERRHRKTNHFLTNSEGLLKESECLEILHNLTVEDYVATSKSYNPNHIGNQLFIFEPDADWELNDGTILENLKIYVKLDIDETTQTAVALVSMHEVEHDEQYPYRG